LRRSHGVWFNGRWQFHPGLMPLVSPGDQCVGTDQHRASGRGNHGPFGTGVPSRLLGSETLTQQGLCSSGS
jgi:hypothetical protein